MSIFCAVIFVSADHLIDASTPDEEEAEEDAGTPHAPPAASRTERAPYRRTTITMMIRRLPLWTGCLLFERTRKVQSDVILHFSLIFETLCLLFAYFMNINYVF